MVFLHLWLSALLNNHSLDFSVLPPPPPSLPRHFKVKRCTPIWMLCWQLGLRTHNPPLINYSEYSLFVVSSYFPRSCLELWTTSSSIVSFLWCEDKPFVPWSMDQHSSIHPSIVGIDRCSSQWPSVIYANCILLCRVSPASCPFPGNHLLEHRSANPIFSRHHCVPASSILSTCRLLTIFHLSSKSLWSNVRLTICRVSIGIGWLSSVPVLSCNMERSMYSIRLQSPHHHDGVARIHSSVSIPVSIPFLLTLVQSQSASQSASQSPLHFKWKRN